MSGRVLVTGADGFVGRALRVFLESNGVLQRAAVRAESGIAGEVVVGEVGARTDWREALDGCSAVVHLANVAHASVPKSRLFRVNVEGTRRLAEDASTAGVKRFVYVSSAKAIAPDDAYGRSKLAAEHALRSVRGIEAVVLRPPLVYGPSVKANFLALLVAVDRGWPLPVASVRNRRSLVYVGNLVDAILRCLVAPEAAGRTYGVSDGVPMSTPELVRAMARALGKPARLVPCPPLLLDWIPPLRRLTRSLEVDDAQIRSDLGWRPPYSFEQGLRATAQWYHARGS